MTLRAGRIEEIFADNMRFLWDDDVRFNGFDQTWSAACKTRWASHLRTSRGRVHPEQPRFYVLAATSPYVAAGYQVGQKVRGADSVSTRELSFEGQLGSDWTQQIKAGWNCTGIPTRFSWDPRPRASR